MAHTVRQAFAKITSIFRQPTLTVTQNQFRAGLAIKATLVGTAWYLKHKTDKDEQERIVDAVNQQCQIVNENNQNHKLLLEDYCRTQEELDKVTKKNYQLELENSALKKELGKCCF